METCLGFLKLVGEAWWLLYMISVLWELRNFVVSLRPAGLHGQFQASLDYRMSPCLKIKNLKNKPKSRAGEVAQ